MAKIQPDTTNFTTPMSGQYTFMGGDVWLPHGRLQDAPNNSAGAMIYTSGALFIASGGGKWHQFNMSVVTGFMQPNDASVSGDLACWVGGSTPNMSISGASGVEKWYDDGPLGNHWGDVSVATQPYVASGVQNGREALYLDGTNYLSGVWASLFTGSDLPCTVIAVVRNDVVVGNDQTFLGIGRAANDFGQTAFGVDDSADNRFRFIRSGDDTGTAEFFWVGSTQGEWTVLAYKFSGTEIELYKDASELSGEPSGANAATCTLDQISLGCLNKTSTTEFWVGMVGEMAVYTTSMSEANIVTISKSMIDRWSI